LTLAYIVAGSAVGGTSGSGDYEQLSGTVIFAAGSATATITVVPFDDALVENSESVVVTLTTGNAYTLGTPDTATVNIEDNDVPAGPLVAAGSTWKYLDNGSDQGTAWRAIGFNDSAWSSGQAEFGFGENDQVTVLAAGRVTYYFRHMFSVANPASISALTLRLLRDDGAVVYLNGTEMLRSNMPTGAINSTTRASTTVGGADEKTFFESTLSSALLVSGTNVLAVEIHQDRPNGSDLSFDLELLIPGGPPAPTLPTVTITASNTTGSEPGTDIGAFTVTRTGDISAPLTVTYTIGGSAGNGADYATLPGTVTIPAGASSATVTITPLDDPTVESTETVVLTLSSDGAYTIGASSNATVSIFDNDVPTGPTTLVATGSTWKFLDNGTDQGTAWRESVFVDSAWSSGAGPLGYGMSGLGTTVSFGPDSAKKYTTTYFRQSFTVLDATTISSLLLRLRRDDGAVVYLNGVEVLRSNMPTGAITYQTKASTTVSGADQAAYFEFNMAPSLLVTGTNVLAVEIHQSTLGSSDLVFDLGLTANQ
jgi:hypothetical protein